MDAHPDAAAVAKGLPTHHVFWPLFGVGLDSLGVDGAPVSAPLPTFGPDELLVRHDACGLCFSDIKIIRLGEDHPRIRRTMAEDPVVLGHEIAMTVVGVGAELRERYRVGDRLTIQSDIVAGGVGYAYGYEIPGGLAQYNVIDRRVLDGDEGDHLIPLRPGTGFAEAALAEPWASVAAAYALEYRTGLKPGGTAWIIGGPGASADVTIGTGLGAAAHPARLLLTAVPSAFDAWVRERAMDLGIEVIDIPDVAAGPPVPVDDLVLLDPDAALVETVAPHLAVSGVLVLLGDRPFSRPVRVDVGRIHYDDLLIVGGAGRDIAAAARDRPVRSALRAGGRAWFVGAGGPMGRMHVQRALRIPDPPREIVCTDVSAERLHDLAETFAEEARAAGIVLRCATPAEAATGVLDEPFDDIVVLAPHPAVVSDVARHLTPDGVLNVFAGMARGTFAELDLDLVRRGARVIGHSASTIADLRAMVELVESGTLSTNRSVAAIGSLDAARDGLRAVEANAFPGKVVIYPQVRDFPLTALPDLARVLPSVHARLARGREWTTAAEAEFLRLMSR